MRSSHALLCLVFLAGCTHPLVDPPGATTDLGFDAFHRANAAEVAVASIVSDLPPERISIVPGSADPVDVTLSWIVRGTLTEHGRECLVYPAGAEPTETEKKLVIWSVVLGGEEYRSFVAPPGAWISYIGTIIGLFDPTGFAEIPFDVIYWLQVQTWAMRQLLEQSWEARGAKIVLRAELWDTRTGKLDWSKEIAGTSGRKNDL